MFGRCASPASLENQGDLLTGRVPVQDAASGVLVIDITGVDVSLAEDAVYPDREWPPGDAADVWVPVQSLPRAARAVDCAEDAVSGVRLWAVSADADTHAGEVDDRE